MNHFKKKLDAFVKGKTSFEETLKALNEILPQPSAACRDLLRAIERRYRAGRLPPIAYLELKERIEQNVGKSGQPPAPASSEHRDKRPLHRDAGPLKPAEAIDSTVPESATAKLDGADSSLESSSALPPQWKESAGKLPKIGSIIKDRFVLQEVIAAGGMGVVYKALDLRRAEAKDRHPFVAVKVLNEDFSQYPGSWIALQRETQKSQHLAHPNVITVYDFDHDDHNFFMTMELLEGEPLSERLKRLQGKGLGVKKALPLIEAMGAALVYAHQKGIVHSDFKPGNIFITQEGIVKVLDFGIARAFRQPDQAQETTTVFDPGRLGAFSPTYASCEIIEGASPDPRDDIYALACVAYELLSGNHPFMKLTAVQARDTGLTPKPIARLSRGQWKGLLHGLAFRREERTPTVEQFLEELRGRKGHSLSIALLFCALLGMGGFFLYSYLGQQSLTQRIAQLEALLTAERIDPANIKSAALLLKQLTEQAPQDARLKKARDDLALVYLKLAQEAQVTGDWRAARGYVREGLALSPSQRVMITLESARAGIDQAQRISALEQRFAEVMVQIVTTPATLQEALAILEELASLSPKHSLLTEGRQLVAEQLAKAALERGKTGRWREGLQLVHEALVSLPGSPALMRAQSELEQGYRKELSEDRPSKLPKNIHSPPLWTLEPNEAPEGD